MSDEGLLIPGDGVVMAIDYGRVRVGLARSDAVQIISSAIGFIRRQSDAQVAQAVVVLARRENAVGLLIGEPLHGDGGAGANTRWVTAFIRELRQAGWSLPIVRIDERLSTQEAASRLLRRGRAHSGHAGKEHIDAESARVILERWLQQRER